MKNINQGMEMNWFFFFSKTSLKCFKKYFENALSNLIISQTVEFFFWQHQTIDLKKKVFEDFNERYLKNSQTLKLIPL